MFSFTVVLSYALPSYVKDVHFFNPKLMKYVFKSFIYFYYGL